MAKIVEKFGFVRSHIVGLFTGMLLRVLPALLLVEFSISQTAAAQRYSDFQTPTPIESGDYLVLGFMGGREPWDNEKRWVRKLALKLRSMELPRVHIETIENTKRGLALELVRKALDRNQDQKLDESERADVRIILYGHSFGGAAVVKLSRQLEAIGVPVLLSIQIDSIGLNDAVIPSSVRRAVNLYQRNGWLIRGEPEIRAAEPSKTEIVGNFRYDYRRRHIDISHVFWFKKLFRVAHTKMGHDPEVWEKVEELILSEMNRKRSPD